MTSGSAHIRPLALLVVIGLFASESPVHAYLDPGSGSMLLQVLLGGFAALGVAIRLYWQRGTARFRHRKVEHDRR